MNNETEFSELSKAGQSILKHLFYDKIVVFESNTKHRMVLAKQLSIRQTLDQVEQFIKTNPYAFFEVCILEESTTDIANVQVSVTVKNFKYFSPATNPQYFKLVINKTWKDFDVYQNSVDGVSWIKL